MLDFIKQLWFYKKENNKNLTKNDDLVEKEDKEKLTKNDDLDKKKDEKKDTWDDPLKENFFFLT
jgi:hypothetical protein